MNAFRFKSLAALVLVALTATAAHAVTIDWVTVGNAGNAADTTGYGAVSYEYRIGKYEVTNGQYASFLNAVASTDPYSLYNGNMASDPRGGILRGGVSGSYNYTVKANMGDKPVVYVSWFDAARFANWMQSGQGSGGTETGAYTLSGSTGGLAPAKNPNATLYVPTESEWYKPAYYKGGGTNSGYWSYATASDSVPTVVSALADGSGSLGGVSPVTAGNSANFMFGAQWGGGNGNVTTVGSNGGPSAYDTFDMSGNVWEWNDLDGAPGSTRGFRGGSWGSLTTDLHLSSSSRDVVSAASEFYSVGFRLAGLASAAVPEIDPAGLGSVLALVTGALGLLERRRKLV